MIRNVFMIALVVLAVACARKDIESRDIEGPIPNLAGKTISAEQVEKAIIDGAIAAKWLVVKTAPGRIEVMHKARGGDITASIDYTDAEYVIMYQGEEEKSLLRQYNRIARKLDQSIKRQMSKFALSAKSTDGEVPHLSDRVITAEQVKKAVLNGSLAAGWLVEKTTPNRIEIFHKAKGGPIRAAVDYTGSTYTITYLGDASKSLLRQYGKLERNLDQAIKSEMSKFAQ
ncbi:hypothetical protein FACS1894186_3840 [Alphaproteobacteria bacterium]|nr:hypothetical protein FACS1894186_3840 [Alphaproteobacteria bacterium]